MQRKMLFPIVCVLGLALAGVIVLRFIQQERILSPVAPSRSRVPDQQVSAFSQAVPPSVANNNPKRLPSLSASLSQAEARSPASHLAVPRIDVTSLAGLILSLTDLCAANDLNSVLFATQHLHQKIAVLVRADLGQVLFTIGNETIPLALREFLLTFLPSDLEPTQLDTLAALAEKTSEPISLRIHAIRAISRTPKPAQYVDSLIDSDVPKIRRESILALSTPTAPRHFQILRQTLHDSDPLSQTVAIQSLARSDSQEARALLLDYVHRTEPATSQALPARQRIARMNAVRSLGNYPQPETLETLLRVLHSPNEHTNTHKAAAEALAAHGTDEALRALGDRLQSSSPGLAVVIERALAATGNPMVLPWLQQREEETTDAYEKDVLHKARRTLAADTQSP